MNFKFSKQLNTTAIKLEKEKINSLIQDTINQRTELKKKATTAQLEMIMRNVEMSIVNELNPKITEELLVKLVNEYETTLKPILKQQLETSLRNEIRPKIETSLRNEIRPSIENALRNEIRPSIETALRNEMRQKIETSLRNEIRPSIETALRNEMRQSIETALRNEMRSKIEKSLIDENVNNTARNNTFQHDLTSAQPAKKFNQTQNQKNDFKITDNMVKGFLMAKLKN